MRIRVTFNFRPNQIQIAYIPFNMYYTFVSVHQTEFSYPNIRRTYITFQFLDKI